MDWVGELYRVIKLISYGGTSRRLTTQLISALNETVTPSGSAPLVFEALITQTGTDAPVITSLLRNQLTPIPSFAYVGAGLYNLTLSSTYAFIENLMIEIGSGNLCNPDWSPNLTMIQKITGIPNDQFVIQTWLWDGLTFVWNLSDEVLFETPIRLSFYPNA